MTRLNSVLFTITTLALLPACGKMADTDPFPDTKEEREESENEGEESTEGEDKETVEGEDENPTDGEREGEETPQPCQRDEDCDPDLVCDIDTGECVLPISLDAGRTESDAGHPQPDTGRICEPPCPARLDCVNGKCRCSNNLTDCGPEAGCVNAQENTNHCGECFNACDDGQPCENGECACMPSPELCDGNDNDCDDEADEDFDLLTDLANCGECGRECDDTYSCMEGECLCANGLSECNTACFDLEINQEHCGACNSPCGDLHHCVAGECACRNRAHIECADECIDARTDPANCGECGNVCAQYLDCIDGECDCEDEDEIDCGWNCIDLQTNRFDCGQCGNACGNQQQCIQGECVCNDPSKRVCGEICENLQTSRENCGECGNMCAQGANCQNGECVCTRYYLGDNPSWNACNPWDECIVCGDTCRNLTLRYDCGACGNECAIEAGEYCEDGECHCPRDEIICDGFCRDTQTDHDHCGECGNECAEHLICANGECRCENEEHTDCNGVCCEHTCCDGVCIDTLNDPLNCGECGNECSHDTCWDGVCPCNEEGWAVCDKECPYDRHDSNMCRTCTEFCGYQCANLQVDRDNCGECGNICRDGFACRDGVCENIELETCEGVLDSNADDVFSYWHDVWYHYIYNDDGYMVGATNPINRDPWQQHTYRFFYDDSGRLVTEEYDSFDDGCAFDRLDGSSDERTTYTYYENGRVATKDHEDYNGLAINGMMTTYIYNNLGHLIREEVENQSGDPLWLITYNYNYAERSMVRSFDIGPDDQIDAISYSEYDTRWRLVMKEHDADLSTEEPSWRRTYSYDAYGWLEVEEYDRDPDGNMDERIVYTYDDNGRLTVKEEYRINRPQLDDLLEWRFTYSYNADGYLAYIERARGNSDEINRRWICECGICSMPSIWDE